MERATADLRVLLLDVVDSTYRLWPQIDLALYVDDMHIESHGTASEARSLVAGTTDHIIHAFQDLDLEVWAKKSTAIAGRTSLAASLVRAMASRKVTAAKQIKMLGAPAGGGRRRAVRALHVWVTAFHKRIPRIHALRKMGVRTEQLTSPNPRLYQNLDTFCWIYFFLPFF